MVSTLLCWLRLEMVFAYWAHKDIGGHSVGSLFCCDESRRPFMHIVGAVLFKLLVLKCVVLGVSGSGTSAW
jgi:hypothetical protein